MSRAWQRRDTGLTLRMITSFIILTVLYLAFLGVLAYLGVGFIPITIVAAVPDHSTMVLLRQDCFVELWCKGGDQRTISRVARIGGKNSCKERPSKTKDCCDKFCSAQCFRYREESKELDSSCNYGFSGYPNQRRTRRCHRPRIDTYQEQRCFGDNTGQSLLDCRLVPDAIWLLRRALWRGNGWIWRRERSRRWWRAQS